MRWSMIHTAIWGGALLTIGCSDRSPTTSRDAAPKPIANLLAVPALHLEPRTRRAWETNAAALVEAVRNADGYAVVAFKQPASPRVAAVGGLRPAVSADAVAQGVALVQRPGIEILGMLRSIGAVRVHFQDPDAVASLRDDPLVDFIEPRHQITMSGSAVIPALPGGGHATAATDAGLSATQPTGDFIDWGVKMVRAPDAWSTAAGGNAKVMLIVAGGPANHPDYPPLDPNHCGGSYWHSCDGWEYTGTYSAGLLGAHINGIGIVGVAPVLPASNLYAWNPCFPTQADPKVLACFDDGIASGLDAAVMVGAKVFSFGSFSWRGDQGITLGAAVARAWQADVVMIAGIGGTGPAQYVSDAYPAGFPNVIGVSGVVESGAFATTSECPNLGSDYGPQVDLAAPYSGLGTFGADQYVDVCGGITAASHVVGATLILRSLHQDWTAQQTVDRLFATAKECGPAGRDDQYGYGIVDAAAALGVLPKQSCAPPFSVSGSGPTYVTVKQVYQLTGTANATASAWLWERNDDNTGWYFWDNRQNTSFVAFGGTYTIQWRVTATRASDNATSTDFFSTRVCIPYNATTCRSKVVF